MENLRKIEMYLKGELEEDDLWEFKRALETDPQLAHDLHAYIELKRVMVQTKKIDLMQKLDDIRKSETKKTRFLGLPVYSAIAAALLLLATIGGGILLNYSGNQHQQLFEQYYAAESGSFGLRSDNSTIEQTVAQGLKSYEEGDFKNAIDAFNKAPDNLMGKLYRGLSMIELGKYDLAIGDFESIINHNDNLFVDQAHWYLALTYLKLDQTDKAEEQFSLIAADRSVYRTKAQKILQDLKNK